jgi:hypothetical protein
VKGDWFAGRNDGSADLCEKKKTSPHRVGDHVSAYFAVLHAAFTYQLEKSSIRPVGFRYIILRQHYFSQLRIKDGWIHYCKKSK